MDTFIGHLDKMEGVCGEDGVRYELPLDTLKVPLNPLLGREINLTFTGRIHCCSCGRKIRKTYHEGHCYPCTMTLAACDMCILKPETCHYDKGTCREPAWGEANCFSGHYVYLANSSGLKVGITKERNIPTRWIDQGATQALPIFKVDTRLKSGQLEVIFKDQVADKTNWRKMLSGQAEPIDLIETRDLLMEACGEQIAELRDSWEKDACEDLPDAQVLNLDYPILEYPKKIKSHNLAKNPEVSGRLMGIKGQYLILSTGVMNVRKFTSYEVELSVIA